MKSTLWEKTKTLDPEVILVAKILGYYGEFHRCKMTIPLEFLNNVCVFSLDRWSWRRHQRRESETWTRRSTWCRQTWRSDSSTSSSGSESTSAPRMRSSSSSTTWFPRPAPRWEHYTRYVYLPSPWPVPQWGRPLPLHSTTTGAQYQVRDSPDQRPDGGAVPGMYIPPLFLLLSPTSATMEALHVRNVREVIPDDKSRTWQCSSFVKRGSLWQPGRTGLPTYLK